MKNKSIFLILLILVMCGCSEGTANDSSVPVQGPANLKVPSDYSEETQKPKGKENTETKNGKSNLLTEAISTCSDSKTSDKTVSTYEKTVNSVRQKELSEQKKDIAPAAEMPHSEDPQPEKSKNAEERDSQAIAGKLIEYLNEYRVAQGSPPAKVLTEYIPYAEYRSRQLGFHFAHDTMDEREAATVLKIGTYVNPLDYGLEGEPYYTAEVREAIGYSGFVGTVEEVARNLADMVRGSPAHWAYVGGAEYTGIAVGITYTSDLWYIDVAMKN